MQRKLVVALIDEGGLGLVHGHLFNVAGPIATLGPQQLTSAPQSSQLKNQDSQAWMRMMMPRTSDRTWL